MDFSHEEGEILYFLWNEMFFNIVANSFHWQIIFHKR